MADFFTHFSCVLDVGTVDNAAKALDLYNAFMDELAAEDPPSDGFRLSVEPEYGGTKLWMRDDVTGVHRTWLARDGRGKAPVAIPRRAMGDLLGHAVRFGTTSDVLAAGEGIETVLSLHEVMPDLPLAACLFSAHLAAMAFPPTLRRLYVLRDDDPAGDHAVATLMARTQETGIDCLVLSPRLADFNDDLRYLGRGAMRAILHPQLAPQDVARFLHPVMH